MGYCQSCARACGEGVKHCPQCGGDVRDTASGIAHTMATGPGGMGAPVAPSDGSGASPAAQKSSGELQAGTDVAGYVVEGKLGEGGMGSVYAAVHPDIGKKAAIKVISHALCRDEQAVQRFKQEARAVNQIGHPNIVDVFAFGELDDGRSYFVMEWLQGKPLSDLSERDELALPETLNVLDQIADALEAAHEKAIVHRDLKPDNVIVEDVRGQLRVKLLDFGIAKLASPGEDAPMAQTQTGMMMGTPGYISPEQARGRGVDHRTDIYALGAMTFELVLGRLPFQAQSAMDMVMAHLTQEPPRLSELWPEAPPPLEDIVARMMAKNADDRPTLPEIRAALAQAHEQAVALVGPARDKLRESFRPRLATPPPQTSPSMVLGAAAAAVADTDEFPLARKRRTGLIVGGVLAVCVAGGAAFVLGGSDAPPAESASGNAATPVAAEAPAAAAAAAKAESAGRLTVVVNVDGATVEVDGDVIANAVRRAELEIAEAGRHEVRVTAPGYEPFTAAVQIAGGAAIEVAANLRELAAAPDKADEGDKAESKRKSRRKRRRSKRSEDGEKPAETERKRKRKGDYTLDPFAE